MNETAVKAEKRIKNICDKLGISPAGRLWLDTCIDPFKDTEQKPIGYPDKEMARSCVQTFHAQIDITRPASVPAGSKWDCHLFMDPMWRNNQLATTTRTANNYAKTGQTPSSYRGGMVIRAGATGAPLDYTKSIAGASFPTDVFADNTDSRIIGAGFEVHNTTEVLERSGSVTVYRVSDDIEKGVANIMESFTDVTSISTAVECVYLPEPPTTAAEAVDLPMSKTWDAALGCYVVPVLNASENPPVSLGLKLVDGSEDGTTIATQIIVGTGVTRTLIGTNVETPFSLSGAYFTGLSSDTVLTVTYLANIEQFPTIVSPLHRLTNKNCPEDFKAIELYTLIAREMPCGVPVDDNFLGSFIGAISRIASQVAPHIPKLIKGLQIGAQVISGVNDLMGGSNDKPSVGVLKVTSKEDRKEKKLLKDVENKAINTIRDIEIIKQQQSGNNSNENPPVVVIERSRRSKNIPANIRPSSKVVRNQRDPNYNRVDRYYDRAMRRNATGNRWMYQDRNLLPF